VEYEPIDQTLLHAWLSARSIARGLPHPVLEHGGFRVDTNTEAEVRRWVFPKAGAGLIQLARTLHEPRHFIKLCGTADQLRAALPEGWHVYPSTYFMKWAGPPSERPGPHGYSIKVERVGAVIAVRVISTTGELAASGYAAETEDAFVYDRISTAPEHRRRGLGSVVMNTLRRSKRHASTPELLVATEDGRALYETLGWQTISPYSTGSIVDD
jgi:GNAT superfamily N-acetyltransferase